MATKSKVFFLDRAIIRSEAFWKLSKTALKVLLCFYNKRKMEKTGPRKGKEAWEITNNGEIVFPYAEAKEKYAISRPTFTRALDQLIKYGFIDINHHGGGLMGDCTTYYISDRWKKYGTRLFVEKSRPKDTRGLGITSKNWEERTGKKRRHKSQQGNNIDTGPSNNNVTPNPQDIKHPSNKSITNGYYDNHLIFNAVRYYRGILNCRNKTVTLL